MTTKKEELYLNQLSSNKHSDNYNQFTNFNLNQGHKCSSEFHVQTFNKLNKVKHFEKQLGSKSTKGSCFKDFKNPRLNTSSKEEKESRKRWKNDSNISNVNSSSTLSLHIAAYENSDPASNDDLSKTFKASKIVEPTFQNQFEFPRQMYYNEVTTPQIMQFNASQTLFSPNQAVKEMHSNNDSSFASELEAAPDSDFSLLRVLTLSDVEIETFWHVWFSILLWMTVSYIFVYIIGFICAVVMLRNHRWMVFISFLFLVMLVIGPSTFGAVTSALIAWTLALANKSITAWHCLILGCGQTLFIILLSFARILATL